ncbi:MAG: hypothetical protein SVN78_06060 [Deferribacterota bacterium]|nr:hypothetical protein [Deferribacterota bacterium]
MWEKFRCYADSHFQTELKTNFYQRTWEMYVGNVLLEKKLEIQSKKSKNEGPDFVIDEIAYIECVAPTKGDPTKADSVTEPFEADTLDEIKFQELPVDKIILRITQAIKGKQDQYNKWKCKNWFNEKLPFIIAVNISALGYSESSSIPYVLKALFGIQHEQINIKTGEISVSIRSEITKSSGKLVPVNCFKSTDFEFVSGVLYSNKRVLNHPENIGEDCIFVNNPFAVNPVDESFVKLFKNWTAVKNNDEIIIKKNYQPQ